MMRPPGSTSMRRFRPSSVQSTCASPACGERTATAGGDGRIGREELGLDPGGLNSGGNQRLAPLLDHAERAAAEIGVDILRRNDISGEERDPVAVDPTVADVDLLQLARQHVKDSEAADVTVLQLVDDLAEHDAGSRAIAVDERRARPGAGGSAEPMIEITGVAR